MQKITLIPRKKYIDEILLFRDTDLVKVVTGIRRSGKSSLLQLVRCVLEQEQRPDRDFVSINLEDRSLNIKTDDDLYSYLTSRICSDHHTCLFIDEIQRVDNWHDVVNSLRVEFDCDIYLTGSNAYLLSGELATYLSGRYVEINVLPLAFEEYALFCDIAFDQKSDAAIGRNGRIITFADLFDTYLAYGGMPAIASLDMTQPMHDQYLSSLYESVITRDILDRDRHASKRLISDGEMLRSLCEYLADTTGRQTAATKVAAALSAAKRTINHSTVLAYLKALEDAYIIYPCKRYDLHGKEILKTMPKYYLVDMGLLSFLKGYRRSDDGFVFENAVYMQLLYEGWKVYAGKLYQKEIDFVATKDGKVLYVQATNEMLSEQTRERELSPLRSVRDNHRKIVVAKQGTYPRDIDGILVLGARDFFCGALRDLGI